MGVAVSNTKKTAGDIPGKIDGKKWLYSKALGVAKDSSTWSGNNMAKRNIWNGKHLNQQEQATGVFNQGGKVRGTLADPAVKEDKKGQYVANRQYSKRRNEGTSMATLTGKAGSLVNKFGGRNWADVASSSSNLVKSAEGGAAGESNLEAQEDLTSSFEKRGRTQVLKIEGKNAGSGEVTRNFARDATNADLADALGQTGPTGGVKIGNAGKTKFVGDGTAAHGAVGSIAPDVEPGTAETNGVRELNSAAIEKDPTGIVDGRNLLPMKAVADGGLEFTTDHETNRKNKMSHADWLKYTYYKGADCVPGQMEGTNGCRWNCAIGHDGGNTLTVAPFSKGIAESCATHSLSCHASKPTADVANDGVLGTTPNDKPCSKGCYGAALCLNPFA